MYVYVCVCTNLDINLIARERTSEHVFIVSGLGKTHTLTITHINIETVRETAVAMQMGLVMDRLLTLNTQHSQQKFLIKTLLFMINVEDFSLNFLIFNMVLVSKLQWVAVGL